MNVGEVYSCELDPSTTWKIVELIKIGGEGSIYKVVVNGIEMALKVFSKTASTPSRAAHIRQLIATGSPHRSFIYPIKIVHLKNGCLGIFMPLIPGEFYEVAEMAGLPAEKRPSLRETLKAAKAICIAFKALIRSGRIYVDISAAQILIAQTGEVRICDVTNIVDRVTPEFHLCTFRYTDPQLWLGKTAPSVTTGRFSLATVMFQLLCCGLPFHGKKLPRILGPEDENRLLHLEPVFIFDPDDTSNAADPAEHSEVIVYWSMLTTKLRKLFTEQFTVGLREPNRRAIETQWIDALIDMYAACFVCRQCGAEVFYDPAVPSQKCWNCQLRLPRPARLRFANRREVVLRSDTEISRYDITGRVMYDFTAVGRVVTDGMAPGSIELENISASTWLWRRGLGPQSPAPCGQKVPLYRNTCITFGSGLSAVVAD
jgi:DNA-binding helix-hairpin-helix protein with protein kinase domain